MSICTTASLSPSAHQSQRPNPRPLSRPGGHPPAPTAAVEGRVPSDAFAAWQRRLLVLFVAVVVTALVVIAAGFGVGHASAATDAPIVVAVSSVYVVQPGDTLWTIAAKVAPTVFTPRAVAALRSAAGTSSLMPGQRIALPKQWQ